MFAPITAWLVDSWTVAQKEIKEGLTATLADRKTLAAFLALQLVCGVLIPLWAGHNTFGQTVLLLITMLIPVPLVIHAAADIFAGERERHTLETLLASRLPTQAILVGKILAASLSGWIGAVITLLLGSTTMSLSQLHLAYIFQEPKLVILSLVLSFLVSLFAACTGAYISLRTSSIHQAQLSIGLLLGVMFLVSVSLTTMLIQLVPVPALRDIAPGRLVVALAGLGVGLFVVDLCLYVATSLRFKRRLLIIE